MYYQSRSLNEMPLLLYLRCLCFFWLNIILLSFHCRGLGHSEGPYESYADNDCPARSLHILVQSSPFNKHVTGCLRQGPFLPSCVLKFHFEFSQQTILQLWTSPQPSSECEAEVDLVLIQTSFVLLWKLSLKNTSQHKNNLIYIIKQKGLYQNKVTVSPASIHNCKMAYSELLNMTNMHTKMSLFVNNEYDLKFLVPVFLRCLLGHSVHLQSVRATGRHLVYGPVNPSSGNYW